MPCHFTRRHCEGAGRGDCYTYIQNFSNSVQRPPLPLPLPPVVIVTVKKCVSFHEEPHLVPTFTKPTTVLSEPMSISHNTVRTVMSECGNLSSLKNKRSQADIMFVLCSSTTVYCEVFIDTEAIRILAACMSASLLNTAGRVGQVIAIIDLQKVVSHSVNDQFLQQHTSSCSV